MNFKLNKEEYNPLYKQYVDNVDMMDNINLKEINLNLPFPSKSFSMYSEDEFLEKLKTDNDFKKTWGEIKG